MSSANSAQADPILSAYTDRLSSLQTKLIAARSDRRNAALGVIGCLALTAVLSGLALANLPISLVLLALPLGVGLYSSLRYMRSGRLWANLQRRSEYFERGILRLRGEWQGRGETGNQFARENHKYQNDLNVIGTGSLFELLCTTRSVLGAERLAAYLLDSKNLEESRQRQEAVRELRDASRLREEMDLLGNFRSQDCEGRLFEEWLSLPAIVVSPVLRYLLLMSSSASLLIGFGLITKTLPWSPWCTWLLALLSAQISVAIILHRQIRPCWQQFRLLTNALTILRQGLRLMENQNFSSQRLRKIVDCVRSQKASAHLGTLDRFAGLFDQCEKPVFYHLSKLLVAGTQLVLAVERWRAVHQQQLQEWINAWAEFEALQAIAGYAFERRGCVFPELSEGEPIFEATQLGHPLLTAERCVDNDIKLDKQRRFYLVTGSNMSGKSTLLRALGLNAVLAHAGGPVRAATARLSYFEVCASLAITDSLLEGRSKFLAEVERLKKAIALSQSDVPVLFLIDEILSGTNSTDRRTAAEVIVRTLLAGGALGALSTHDLALSEIADDPSLGAVLVHMESRNPDNPLAFDYLLRPGVSRHSNALAIVKMMGIAEP